MAKHAGIDKSARAAQEPSAFAPEERGLVLVGGGRMDDGDESIGSPGRFGRKGRKNRQGPEGGSLGLTIHQKKSRRMRRVLTAAIILLIALLGALVYFSYMWITVGSLELGQFKIEQEVREQPSHDIDELKGDDTKDNATTTVKKTEVPGLLSLLGKTQEEAINLVGHGATVVSSIPVNEEGNPVKMNVKLSLTDEPGDARSGTPTVYLGLGWNGMVITAGYSVATSSLGYGALSFVDAIEKEHIIELTLAEAGLAVAQGSATVPTDKSLYSTYASDKTTLVEEACSFSGTVEQGGAPYEWSSVLRYDYMAANASGNLADTIRQVYVYINIPAALLPPPPPPEPDPAAETPPA
ncbi:MAG: hypothetical protein LBG81_01570 [Coriobacteriaceae bacterium]|jgi:hypothetical protein|nr:hypothetical protein [Coriobacteriaceae bacterium]